jgi:hypothetical protein
MAAIVIAKAAKQGFDLHLRPETPVAPADRYAGLGIAAGT